MDVGAIEVFAGHELFEAWMDVGAIEVFADHEMDEWYSGMKMRVTY
jgi:hypothetical protein